MGIQCHEQWDCHSIRIVLRGRIGEGPVRAMVSIIAGWSGGKS